MNQPKKERGKYRPSYWPSKPATQSVWTFDQAGLLCIEGRECVIFVQERPPHCDRGNYLANLDSVGKLEEQIDGADLWPRFYFDLERAKLEIEAWLKKRGQWIEGS